MTHNTKTLNSLVKKVVQHSQLSHCFTIHANCTIIPVGQGKPLFDVFIKNRNGLKAVISLDELAISEAYMLGDIDIEGDLIEAIQLKPNLTDRNIGIKLWRKLQPLLLGRTKCNPQWIAKHYDSANIQLFCTDHDYDTYTPGNYSHDDESMESGARRKLDLAFQSLNLKINDRVLDIGCGWGGFLRYAAREKVDVTGITLSNEQKKYVEQLIEREKFKADVLYQDFFTFSPNAKYDAAVAMGVIEDLSDYRRVMRHLLTLIKPGGRVYFDFAATKERFGTSTFITKYIWPGTFRMVYMPEFIDAVSKSPFEIISIENDRRNYHLWAKKLYERWIQHKEEILSQSDEVLWRKFLLLFAGTSGIMKNPDYETTAYRVVLELPADHL